jgi:hypothetical protein
MSPVSRKRKPKKTRKPRKSVGAGRAIGWSKPVAAAWWPDRVRDVLRGAGGLLDAAGPRELEQATAELIGGVLHQALAQETMGFALQSWLAGLIDTAAYDDATLENLYLLHGVAAIAPEPLATQSRGAIERLAAQGPSGPSWLAWTPMIAPTGEVQLIRDAYGSRFGVLIACGYPDEAMAGTDYIYLLDVDTCAGIVEVLDAAIYDDLSTACDAWRTTVGVPAVSATPGSVDAELLADLLPGAHLAEHGVMGGESRRRMDNYYRVLRRSADLAGALAAAGRPLPAEPRQLHELRYGDISIDAYVAEFLTWYADRHPAPADDEAVEALAETWLEGSLEEARLSCSPHRVRALQSRIGIEWRGDPLTEPVAELLPEWVRWCADRTGLDAKLASRSVAAARRDLGDWKRIRDELKHGAPEPE